ncbi:hypothetical protein Sjap_003273 [Stephania japonica]|uniref:Uncharacterized protein n=1 Tax=Stephania japonica TaxID=461633 RepID=A0AAP0KQ10_9MAGN
MGGRRRRRWPEKELTGAKRTRADGRVDDNPSRSRDNAGRAKQMRRWSRERWWRERRRSLPRLNRHPITRNTTNTANTQLSPSKVKSPSAPANKVFNEAILSISYSISRLMRTMFSTYGGRERKREALGVSKTSLNVMNLKNHQNAPTYFAASKLERSQNEPLHTFNSSISRTYWFELKSSLIGGTKGDIFS